MILKKLQQAIDYIDTMDIVKKGRNTYSGYDYYLPEQISGIVKVACKKVGIRTKFDLKRNELGIYGRLEIWDLDEVSVEGEYEIGSPLIFEMASDIPEIKATNVSQQLGGAMTYTKRYMLMNAFEISDNNLDFDTTENTVKREEEYKVILSQALKKLKTCKNTESVTQVWEENKVLHFDETFKEAVSDVFKKLE